jgi:hypothetical protein
MPYYSTHASASSPRRPQPGYILLMTQVQIANADQIPTISDAFLVLGAPQRAASPGNPQNAPITTADDRHEPPPVKGPPLLAREEMSTDVTRAREPMIPSGMKARG